MVKEIQVVDECSKWKKANGKCEIKNIQRINRLIGKSLMILTSVILYHILIYNLIYLKKDELLYDIIN